MAKSDYRILLVEDEEHMVAAIELVLGERYDLQTAGSVAEARSVLRAGRPDLVLLDLGLPDESGMVLLKETRKSDAPPDVIVITGTTDVQTAVQAMKLGARDYIVKPFEREDLLLGVEQAHENWRLRCEVTWLRSELYGAFSFESIVAESAQMKHVLAIAAKMAKSDATVLITGESGTGKELIARAVHTEGTRGKGPFVAANCAQFTPTLLESELFGHEKGAFTGASQRRKGRFEMADGGTLFLDEVGNTSLEMQAKILRVVETKTFERVGGQQTIQSDVRMVAATNADLEAEVRGARFREDLYYRLNVVRIEVPPLRERRDDVPALCERFLAAYRAKSGHATPRITPEALEVLKGHDWPGNVRELQNVLEMAVALEDGEHITTRYFPPHIMMRASLARVSPARPGNILEHAVQSFESRFLEEQLRLHGWNHRETARSLGMHRNTVEKKIKKYGIRAERPGLP